MPYVDPLAQASTSKSREELEQQRAAAERARRSWLKRSTGDEVSGARRTSMGWIDEANFPK